MGNRRKLSNTLAISIFLLILGLRAEVAHCGTYGGGSGTADDPYLICTPEQMNAIGADSNDWDKHFKLMADIDLAAFTGTDFNLIGYFVDWYDRKPFTGVFDGDGHAISNFSYDCNGVNHTGLFRHMDDPNAKIKNLSLINPIVYAGTGNHVGSLVGMLTNGSIVDCSVQSGSVSGWHSVGGLVGNMSYNGTVENSYSTATVAGRERVGGLVGVAAGSTALGTSNIAISNSYSGSSVSGYSDIGGLVGSVSPSHGEASVCNCYSTGSVAGFYYVGGLVGRTVNLSVHGTLTVCNSYSTSPVSGDNCAGGLIGQNSGDHYIQILMCYWDIETSGQVSSDGGRGKTASQMKDRDTFVGWACDPVWTIDDGNDYPRLLWENRPGQLITKPFYGGGSGEPNDPYLIYTPQQFNWIGAVYCDWDKHFKLMAEIDLSCFTQRQLNVIGQDYYNAFRGVFDGNGHTISNFGYSSQTGASCVGLFGYVRGSNAQIKNLGVVDPNIDAGADPHSPVGPVGSLAGYFGLGTIANCWAIGGQISGNDYVGGLVGRNVAGRIVDCCSTTTVLGHYQVGGLVGGNYCSSEHRRATINNSYSRSVVFGDYATGGLVGQNYTYSSGEIVICNCFSGAIVSGHNAVGGLIGKNDGQNVVVSHSYSAGDVSGDKLVGGLVGDNYLSGVSNCYSLSNVSGTSKVGGLIGSNAVDTGYVSRNYSIGLVLGDVSVGGLVGYNNSLDTLHDSFWDVGSSGQKGSAGGTGKTSEEMRDLNTFLEAGWDFVGEYENGPSDDWAEPEEGGYPILWWQLSPPPPLPVFSGGSGEANEPYLISTPSDLNKIGHNPRLMGAHFQLVHDINVANTDVFVIGSWLFPFRGGFDGDGYSVSNLKYDSSNSDYAGLFRYVDGPNSQIRNLGLIDPNIVAGETLYVGSLVGNLQNGTVHNCWAQGGNVFGRYYVGGLIGQNCQGRVHLGRYEGEVLGLSNNIGGLVGSNAGDISNSSSSRTVSGDNNVGGLAGWNTGHIHASSWSGEVYGKNRRVGGLVGCNGGDISASSSSGSVSGVETVGGLAGLSNGSVWNCCSTGTISGEGAVGGLIGKIEIWPPVIGADEGIVANSHFRGSVWGENAVAGLVGSVFGGTISTSYSMGTIAGTRFIGGLAGFASYWRASHCYSAAVLSGNEYIGGMVGWGDPQSSNYTACFWDRSIEPLLSGIGNESDPNVIGESTENMQTASTFINADWDFNTPVWIMCDEPNYPKLWWEGCPVPPIEVYMKFTPQALNPGSKGRWVKAHFVLPEGFVVEDVDANSPAKIIEPFEPDIESEYMNVFVNDADLVEIEAVFDRGEFCAAGIDGNSVELTAVGSLTTGQQFYGTETIRITTNYFKFLADLAFHWLDHDCGKPDWCGGVDLNHDSSVDFIDFALFDGCCIEVAAD
ncbi:MAG: GLUG motif-containing protein [Planctomycetota bacterium]|jgi:hypothetical protein